MKRVVNLAWVFFWISTVTLGGGMAMLPLIDREFVEKRKYLTKQEMVDIVAVMQSLPGLIAVNMAVLIGYRVKGVLGALVSAFASVLSPFVIIALIASGLSSLTDSPTLDHIFLGVRAGTAALILMSLFKLVKQVMDGPLAWSLGVIAFVASGVIGIDITFVILFGFLVGVGHIAICAGARRPRPEDGRDGGAGASRPKGECDGGAGASRPRKEVQG